MDEKFRPTYDLYKSKIERLQTEIGTRLAEMRKYKSVINDLLIESGDTPEYDENETIAALSEPVRTESAKPSQVLVKMGEFAVRPLTKSVKEILTRHGEEAMSFESILDALRRGGVRISG